MLEYLLSLRRPSTRETIPVRDFPSMPAQPGDADFALLASALQRLLAKWPPDVTRRHFPLATQASSALHVQSRLPADLLSDLCHEIAEYVDASVRQAAVRCLRRCAAEPCVAAWS